MAQQPMMTKRRLGKALKRIREQCGKTQSNVVAAGICKNTKISYIENGNGDSAISPGTVADLCDFYEVDRATRELLKDMARNTSKSGWYSQSGRWVRPDTHLYIEFEQDCDSIMVVEENIVTGLFQTKSYALAITEATWWPNFDAQATQEEIVNSRADRAQRFWDVNSKCQIHWLTSFAALTRGIGGEDVLRDQVQHVVAMAALPNVTVSVISPSMGAHPCLRRSFAIFDFDDPLDPSVLCDDASDMMKYTDVSTDVELYRRMFQQSVGGSITLKEFLRDFKMGQIQ